MFQQFLDKDTYAPECMTTRNSQNQKMQDNEPNFIDNFVYNQSDLEYLQSLGCITFPIKNISKAQNTHITNFMFEQDKNLKQETFMLCFDLMDKDKNELDKALGITDGMTGRQFLFKVQGYAHGQTVFTDHIHYLLKGGKLMKCALEKMNSYRQMTNEVTKFVYGGPKFDKNSSCL